MNDLDAMIDASHRQVEEVENTARSLEARICRIPGADRHLPLRQYGSPVNPADIKKNLTLRSLISKNDPSLASYLGLQDGSHRRREEEEQARILQAERMRMLTESTRQQNQAAQHRRENAALNGFNLNTGRRWGQ